MVNKLV